MSDEREGLAPIGGRLRDVFVRARRARDDVAEANAAVAGFRSDDAYREYEVRLRVRKIGDPERAERELRETLDRELPLIFGDNARLVGIRRAARG